MDALELLHRHLDTPGQQRFYPAGEQVPIARVVPDEWREAVIDEHGKIERIPYELCVLRALRDALRRREIYVSGAHRWRNPDEDLPADFDANRDVHYAAIRKPRDPQAFIADLQARLHAGLERLDQAVCDEHGRRGPGHHPPGTAVDRRAGDRPAARPAEHPGAARARSSAGTGCSICSACSRTPTTSPTSPRS